MEFNHNQETVYCGVQMEAVRWMERHPEVFGPCSAREEVKILQVIPNESGRLTEGGSLLVMDILVRLLSGALVNVEIQRVGYLFPGARRSSFITRGRPLIPVWSWTCCRNTC